MGCAVHMCSMLHQRYAEFSPELLGQLQKIYSIGISKDEDKSAVATKYRLGLRLTGEVWTSTDSYMNAQIANTEECIDGQLAGNLGVLIRCNNILYIRGIDEEEEGEMKE